MPGTPTSTAPAPPSSISPTRRRMNARMTISPTSAEPIISARICAASNGNAVQPSVPALPQASVSRPASWLTSPEICPARCVVIGVSRLSPSRRTTSIDPLRTSHAGAFRSPTSNTTSPGANVRAGPLAKRLAVSICAASSTGKICSRRVSMMLMRGLLARFCRLGWHRMSPPTVYVQGACRMKS